MMTRIARSICLIFLLALPLTLRAADSTLADTTATVDSLAAFTDSTADSTRKAAQPDSVLYSADTINFLLDENLIRLTGNARVAYQGVVLTAHRIDFFTATKMLEAMGRPETTAARETVWVSTPQLDDAGDIVEGRRMKYNLDTRKGKMELGSTRFGVGYYTGRQVAMVNARTLNSQQGTYTTCADGDDPHYHFASRRMKLLVNDKIIIKPVLLKIQDIPVMALPFFILPIKKERHSGFLIPRYGSEAGYGRYLKNVGYYFAPNDYCGAKTIFEFYTRAKTRVEVSTQYALRYVLNGYLNGSYVQTRQSGYNVNQRWDLGFGHNQKLSPRWDLVGYGTFASDRSYSDDFKETVNDRAQRQLRSEAYLTRRGENSSFSLRTRHSKTFAPERDITDVSLPAASFSISGNVVPEPAQRRATRVMAEPAPTPWYRKVRYSYSISGDNQYHLETDTLASDTAHYQNTATAGQSAGLTYSDHLGWLNLSPSLNYNESYAYWERTDSTHQTGAYAASLGANTEVYGLFPVPVWRLTALRHVITPSLSYSYTLNRERRDDYYLPFTPDSRRVGRPAQSVGLRLNNIWQAKIKLRDSDQKITLLNGPAISTSYDPVTKKFGSVYTSFYTTIKRVQLSLDFRHTLYNANNHLLFDPERPFTLAHEQDRTFRMSTSLAHTRPVSYPDDVRRYSLRPGHHPADTAVGLVSRPVSAGLNYSLTQTRTRTGTAASNTTQNLAGNLTFNPTRNWNVAYMATYDVTQKKLVSQNIEVVRDLHCWVGRLTWHPTGYRKDLYIRIDIKELPEVKVERKMQY
jgi:lipopolysaccharide assembly outer membrane protein LptD (OstA)